MDKNFFIKSQALGNNYIVFDYNNIDFILSSEAIKRICNVNFGIGSDGILLKVESKNADFGLKIYNPDGSEAEKSGNGLRIFAKFLFDYKFTSKKKFSIETKGGIVKSEIIKFENGRAKLIKVEMGTATFDSKLIPVNLSKKVVFDEEIKVKDKSYLINCVSVGNPHCVILKKILDIDEIKKYGKYIETHNLFPNKVNVQFTKILSPNIVKALIWERGAGYTLASGSSACAIVAVLKKKGLIKNNVIVKMQGGELMIDISDDFEIVMTGEVRQIIEGNLVSNSGF